MASSELLPLVALTRTTRRNIPEDAILQIIAVYLPLLSVYRLAEFNGSAHFWFVLSRCLLSIPPAQLKMFSSTTESRGWGTTQEKARPTLAYVGWGREFTQPLPSNGPIMTLQWNDDFAFQALWRNILLLLKFLSKQNCIYIYIFFFFSCLTGNMTPRIIFTVLIVPTVPIFRGLGWAIQYATLCDHVSFSYSTV
jgi:hypothetical protein